MVTNVVVRRIDIAAVEVQVVSVVVVVRRRGPVIAVLADIVHVRRIRVTRIAIAIAGSGESGNISGP